ncbi:MAG TPA: flavodoxin domain-containing protein [Paraburkholderia sp.]
MTVSEFRGPGLTDAQLEQIRALAASLDSRQLMWVSGFLAGFEQACAPGTRAPLPAAEGNAGIPAARALTVLYGSETGNSAALATMLAERAAQRGLATSLCDMATYKTRQLKDERDLLIIASTYGEGDPPQSAAGFFEFLEGRKAPSLRAMRFAVLALGDSTYEHYCEAGKRLDQRLEVLGAHRLKSRVDCDVDYEGAANAWIDDILASLGHDSSAGGSVPGKTYAPPSPAIAPTFDKRNAFPARIIENFALTGRGSSKETRHIELSLEGSGLSFEPGDALGVLPTNEPTLVRSILRELDLAPSVVVDVKGKTASLGDALASDFEIATLTPRFLEHWARLSDAHALKHLSQADRADKRAAYMRSHHVIDVIRQFPVKGIDAQLFLAGLRPLAPRLYSIASSLAAAPGEAHVTVSTVRYDLHGERRSGVASGQIADRGTLDVQLPVYVHKNPNFRLPADDVPIIMIARIHDGTFRLTPNQNLTIAQISDAKRAQIERLLDQYRLAASAYGSSLRLNSMACVALPTCGLAMAESERYLPSLVTRIEALLEKHHLSHVPVTMRMSGCPNGCSRPYVAEIGLTGRAPGRYNLYLGGGFHGERLNRMYLENVGEVAILDALDLTLGHFARERREHEHFGDFVIRAGYVKAVEAGRDFNN